MRTSSASSCHRNGSKFRAAYRPKYTSQMTSSSSCNYAPMRIPLCRWTSPSRSGCTLCARSYRLTYTSRRYRQIRGYGPKPHRPSASWYHRSGCRSPSRRPQKYTSAPMFRRNCHSYALKQALCRCPYNHNANNSRNKIQPQYTLRISNSMRQIDHKTDIDQTVI